MNEEENLKTEKTELFWETMDELYRLRRADEHLIEVSNYFKERNDKFGTDIMWMFSELAIMKEELIKKLEF
jgi:hypothetical protein